MDNDGNVQVYHNDGLGSVRAITNLDDRISVIETDQTDAFGVPTQTRGGISQPFQFTGQQSDASTGLYYLRARMYDPTIGRFITRDTWGGATNHPLSLNRYSYVENSPVVWRDPSGKFPLVILAGAALGGGIDLGAQLLENDGDWSKVNWVRVGGSALAGAAGAGLASGVAEITAQVGLRIALNAAGSAAIGAGVTAGENALTGKPIGTDVAKGALLSGALGAGSEGLADAGQALQQAMFRSQWANTSLSDRLLMLNIADFNHIPLDRPPEGLLSGAGTALGLALSNAAPALPAGGPAASRVKSQQ